MDEKYSSFVRIVHDEMNEKLTPLSKGGRRKFTPYKPYWCQELSRLWKNAHDKENVYIRFKGARGIKNKLRVDFTKARDTYWH